MRVYVVTKVEVPGCDCCSHYVTNRVFAHRVDADKCAKIWSKNSWAGDIVEVYEREVEDVLS